MAMSMSSAIASSSSCCGPIPPSRIPYFPNSPRFLAFKSIDYRTNGRYQIQASRHLSAKSSSSSAVSTTAENVSEEDEGPMSLENLHRFVKFNLGNWTGSFYQFDSNGNLLHKISTKLTAGSYGEAELISLIQTLYIKQPTSSTVISGDDKDEEAAEWAEYKIKESNMFTVDKYQQISFFPKHKAFALRYQTAGMLEYVLRQGVLGEDDTGEESPRGLKLPSRRPSIVCENCLSSLEKDARARAFHILDPKGSLDMLLIFLEERGKERNIHPSLESSRSEDDVNRIQPFLGQWKGYSVTKRSGVYGATIAEHDTVVSLVMNEDGQLIQDVNSTTKGDDSVTTNVHWTGTLLPSYNQVVFDKGFQFILLPGGMYMGLPCDIANSVAESMCFHLEFCWVESPGNKRQRLVRTYDADGQAVSSTYHYETKEE